MATERHEEGPAMEIFQLDERGHLFIAPDIDDWRPVAARGIDVIIDLDGVLDVGVPAIPDQVLYLYFPFDDDRALPDLAKLHAVARLGASLVASGRTVLAHCGMGHNRCALVAGLILIYLGMAGDEAVTLIRRRRQGALYNEVFAAYLREQRRPARRLRTAAA
jgi:protein-tyrosine phosphatase